MISHQYKVIFVHIPKCAGRSISEAFHQPFDHFTAEYYSTNHPDCWNTYTLFTTVRNPYERLVSMYHYIKNEPVHTHHAITNNGQMLPFKEWVMTNLAAFKNEFGYPSTEGERQTDGDIGSPFWFSSQVRRLSSGDGQLYPDLHILPFESGMPAVARFLADKTGRQWHIPHLNRSNNQGQQYYLEHYDNELLNVINGFAPFAKDCALLDYQVIRNRPE